MATPDEIKRLEFDVEEAQRALARARAENAAADKAWTKMVAEAERMCAQSKSVSAEFIIGAAAKARAAQVPVDYVEKRRTVVVPLHKWRSTEHFSFYDPSSKDRK